MLYSWSLFLCSLHISKVFGSGRIFVFKCFCLFSLIDSAFRFRALSRRFSSRHRIVLPCEDSLAQRLYVFVFSKGFLTLVCL